MTSHADDDDATSSCKVLSFESPTVVSTVNGIYVNIPYILFIKSEKFSNSLIKPRIWTKGANVVTIHI